MVKDLQIAQARRDDCGDFTEALRANVVYLWNGRVHASETRRALDLSVGRGGMKRLMEEAAARHQETVHYSASAGIRVRSNETRKTNEAGFWPLMLEGLVGVRPRGKTGPGDDRVEGPRRRKDGLR